MSLPNPPLRVSAPDPPSSVSLPGPPKRISSQSFPVKISFPYKPRIVPPPGPVIEMISSPPEPSPLLLKIYLGIIV